MSDTKIKKILIVEDEKAYSRPLTLKLENAGFEVVNVTNGEEAIEAVEKEHFDLLLCDLIMPKVNGFLVLEYIRDKHINVPVVVLSNLNQSVDEEKTRSLGAVDFIPKSETSLVEVVAKIEQLVI